MHICTCTCSQNNYYCYSYWQGINIGDYEGMAYTNHSFYFRLSLHVHVHMVQSFQHEIFHLLIDYCN